MGTNFQTTEISNDTSISHSAKIESYDSYFKKLGQSGLHAFIAVSYIK